MVSFRATFPNNFDFHNSESIGLADLSETLWLHLNIHHKRICLPNFCVAAWDARKDMWNAQSFLWRESVRGQASCFLIKTVTLQSQCIWQRVFVTIPCLFLWSIGAEPLLINLYSPSIIVMIIMYATGVIMSTHLCSTKCTALCVASQGQRCPGLQCRCGMAYSRRGFLDAALPQTAADCADLEVCLPRLGDGPRGDGWMLAGWWSTSYPKGYVLFFSCRYWVQCAMCSIY